MQLQHCSTHLQQLGAGLANPLQRLPLGRKVGLQVIHSCSEPPLLAIRSLQLGAAGREPAAVVWNCKPCSAGRLGTGTPCWALFKK